MNTEKKPSLSAREEEGGQILNRRYDEDFVATPAYRDSLPDLQNRTGAHIQGANVPILQVGASNFRLPVKVLMATNEPRELEIAVTGTVSLGADRKGVNMSRILRTFYEFKERIFTLELLEEILLRMKKDLGSSRAHLILRFSYPLLQKSLRSDLEGYQFYDAAYEGIIDDLDIFRKRLHFDFVYSSVCPNSSELSEHARERRNTYAIPHSQRSKARISVEVRAGVFFSIEDLHRICVEALRTETQVMVKREDEQAFAELNAANVKFVEDAARLLYEKLNSENRLVDFQIACAHLESLHSHDTVAVVCKGVSGGFTGSVEDFGSLVC